MARANASRFKMHGVFESTYGTAPSSGFFEMPLISASAGAQQGLLASNLIGVGRDPEQPARDVINVSGDINVPLDVRHWGTWLKLAFGDPSTTGSGPYTHVFTSGGINLPAMTIEKWFPEVPLSLLMTGVKAGSLSWQMQPSGFVDATVQVIGQGEAKNTSSQAGTPGTRAVSRFNQFQGSVERNGSPLASVLSVSPTYSNNLDAVRTIRADGLIDGADEGVAACTGQIVLRLADTTLIDQAIAGGAAELDLKYEIDASNSFEFTIHAARLSRPVVGPQGPQGIDVTFDFQAEDDATAGQMITATLINDVASY